MDTWIVVAVLLATASFLWVRTGGRHRQSVLDRWRAHQEPSRRKRLTPAIPVLQRARSLPRWGRSAISRPLETAKSRPIKRKRISRGACLRVCGVTAVATVAGCDGSGGELHLDGGDLSPVTEVEGEVTSATHLEQLKGLYRDRERLLAENGEAHAAGQGKSLEEAKKKVDELIAFHVRGVFFQTANEEGIVPTRARLADIIAGYGRSCGRGSHG